MWKKFALYPWYILFLPLFFILHTTNEYFGLLTANIVMRYTIFYLIFSILLFAATILFFKNLIKAGIYSAVLLMVFFFWGASHDFLKKMGTPSFFVSYKFLIPLVAFFLIFLAVKLKYRFQLPENINNFFSIFFVLILVIEISTIVFKSIKTRRDPYDTFHLDNSLSVKTIRGNDPDIFCIVFDEYTSSKALKKYFNYDNGGLDSILKENNFYISTNSKSNYNSTPYSLASLYSMQYYNEDLEGTQLTTKKMLSGCHLYKQSTVPRLLEANGYKILNFGLINLANSPTVTAPYFSEYEYKILEQETFWGRIKRDILWNITTALPGFNQTINQDEDYESNRKNFQLFFNQLKTESKEPRLVVGHLMMPHRPFNVDRYGNRRSLSKNDLKESVHDSLYIEQLIYANTLIDSLARTANNKHSNRPFVLVIAGDHGNRYANWGSTAREKQFMNLNAYYFSDNNYDQLYDSISPVNSFRVIFNKYFNSNLVLLKDSTVRFGN